MKRILEQVLKIVIYVSFFVPLILAPSSFIFPFIVPKILLFRSLVVVMLGLYILLLFCNYREYRPRFTITSLALASFFASFAISTFVGFDSYHSFWDNHERMLGLFTIAHYVVYYCICTSFFKTWSDWKTALKIFLVAGSFVMFVGVLQKINPNLLLNQGSDRVASTLGNAIYVGGYGLFLFFAAMLLFIKERSTGLKIVYGGLGALALAGLFFSGTRGSVLGLMAGLGFVLVSYAFLMKDNKKIRTALFGAMAGGVVLIGILFAFRNTSFVENLPAIGRLFGTSLSNGTSDTRFIAWKIGIESWKERPVFGWGPNNFFYAFNKYYNPRSLEYGYGETWFDNAHNIIINTLTVQGLFGVITYLAIFGVAIFTLWSSKENREKRFHLVAWGGGFLFAHLIQNITVFENPTSYLYFFFWLAMLNRLTSVTVYGEGGEQDISVEVIADKKVGLPTIAVVAGCVGIFIFIFNIQPARANQKTLFALQQLSRDPVSGIAASKEAIAFSSPHIDDIRSDIARTVSELLGANYEKLPENTAVELLNIAYNSLKENLQLHPADIRAHLLLAQLGQLGFVITENPAYIGEAEQYMTLGLSYSPRRQQFLYTLANFKLQLGKNDEAITLLQQALDDDPKIVESYWRFAYLYHLIGQNDKARQLLTLARERGLVFTDQARQVEALVVSSTPSTNGK